MNACGIDHVVCWSGLSWLVGWLAGWLLAWVWGGMGWDGTDVVKLLNPF